MKSPYAVEAITGLPGERHQQRIGMPRISFDKAKDSARDASIIHGHAYVYGFDGHIYAAYEGGNELPREQW